jgi:hypothetical protein
MDCEICGKPHSFGSLNEVGGKNICDWCKNNFRICEICGEIYERGTMCEDCLLRLA